MIGSDIWPKYHEWYFKIVFSKFHEPLDYKENQRVHLIEVLRRPIETKNELIRQIK